MMKLVQQQPGAREIKVKLMLFGGHAAMLVLPPEHPLLAQLLQTVAAPANGRPESPPAVFQIPVEGARASLTFAELRVYDDEFVNGKFSSTDTFQLVEPRNNSIVFFNAAIMHEVVPVQVPSKDFADSRFTVNGWVHRT